eukprot:sb/3473226/
MVGNEVTPCQRARRSPGECEVSSIPNRMGSAELDRLSLTQENKEMQEHGHPYFEKCVIVVLVTAPPFYFNKSTTTYLLFFKLSDEIMSIVTNATQSFGAEGERLTGYLTKFTLSCAPTHGEKNRAFSLIYFLARQCDFLNLGNTYSSTDSLSEK